MSENERESKIKMFMEVVQISEFDMAERVMDHFNHDIDRSVDFVLEEVNPEVDKKNQTMRSVIADKLSILSRADENHSVQNTEQNTSFFGLGILNTVIYGAYDLVVNRGLLPIAGILLRPIWYLINIFVGVQEQNYGIEKFVTHLRDKMGAEKFGELNLVQVRFSDVKNLKKIKFPLIYFFINENDAATMKNVVHMLKKKGDAQYLKKFFICGVLLNNESEIDDSPLTKNRPLPFALFMRRKGVKRPIFFELKFDYQCDYMMSTIMQPILMDYIESGNRGVVEPPTRFREFFGGRSNKIRREPNNVSEIVREQNAAYEETMKKDMLRMNASKPEDPVSERKELIRTLFEQKRSKNVSQQKQKKSMVLRVSIPDDKNAFSFECSPEDQVNELVDFIVKNHMKIEKDFFISTIMPAKRLYKFSKDHDKSCTFRDFDVVSAQKLTLSYISDSEEYSE